MIRDGLRLSVQRRSLITLTCSQYAALDAAGVLALATVAPGPNVDAFTGGIVLGISAAFVVLAALGGLAIVRRILGS
jgi:hypothetical protein